MDNSDALTLTPEVKRLLTQAGTHKLTEDEFLQLQLHLKMLARWAADVPQKTRFFFDNGGGVAILPRVPGFTRAELSIAVYLQPLHSQLCALALQVLWKADQTIRSLCSAMNSGHQIVAATMARSLVETAAAFGVETNEIRGLWNTRKREPAPSAESLVDFVAEVNRKVCQVYWGTKLTKEKEPETGITRTNILTLVDKAEKISENPGLRRLYDVLCDAVHPSFGANQSFWSLEPDWKQGSRLEISIARKANGASSDLPFAIGMSSLEAIPKLDFC